MDIKDISLTYGIIGVISMISTILFLGSLISYRLIYRVKRDKKELDNE